jgi:hypothetical protein
MRERRRKERWLQAEVDREMVRKVTRRERGNTCTKHVLHPFAGISTTKVK